MEKLRRRSLRQAQEDEASGGTGNGNDTICIVATNTTSVVPSRRFGTSARRRGGSDPKTRMKVTGHDYCQFPDCLWQVAVLTLSEQAIVVALASCFPAPAFTGEFSRWH